MIDKYEEIFDRYKKFIEENSKYNTRVVKHNTNTSTYFPIVCCVLSNNIDTDYATNDKIEYYEGFYFTIDIFTKDKTINNSKVASQIISDELTKINYIFFWGIKYEKNS